MKKLFENWKRYLDEDQLDEKLMLKRGKMGWWKFSQFVAEAYAAAPDFEERTVKPYRALADWLDGHFGRISTRARFEFVPEHVYETAPELRQRVEDEGVMYVSTLDADHPVWTGEEGLITNTMFRAWHDWEGHIEKGKGFNLRGEIAAYNAHAGTSGPPRECIPVLFTEVVGQICCYYQNGKSNCKQKAVILDDFDHYRVGMLTEQGKRRFGHRIDTKKGSPTHKNYIPIDQTGQSEEK